MRPDHHKKRKNARYKKAHGIVEKKEDNSEEKEVAKNKPKKGKSNKKPQPQKKPLDKSHEKEEENEKKENDKSSEENSEDEDFQKRQICSNWSRYEESSTEEEEDDEEEDDFSDDDFDLKGMIEKGTKKFQIEEGKSWVREIDEKGSLPLNVEDFNKEFFEEEANREFMEHAKLEYESEEEPSKIRVCEEPDDLEILLKATESTTKESDNNDIDDLLKTLEMKEENKENNSKNTTKILMTTTKTSTPDDFLASLDKAID